MSRLTFDNIYQCLQSKGIRCTFSALGVKAFTNYYHLGSFRAVHGQCIFVGNVPVNFQNTRTHMHELLNLFECDKVAFTNDDDNYIHYICKIKAIKPTQETSDE